MPDEPSLDVYLEPLVGSDDAPQEGERPYIEPAYLEPIAVEELDDAPRSSSATKKKKVRAGERGAPEIDVVWDAVLAALPRGGPLLVSLWPDVTPAALLREPPSQERFTERCADATRALDAIARKDAEARAKAEVAHRALQQRLAASGASGDALAVELRALRDAQLADLSGALKVISAGARTLDADDVRRIDAAARDRGLTPDDALALARSEGYDVRVSESAWGPLDALPGGPRSMVAAAGLVLRHQMATLRALRDGSIERWISSNDGPDDALTAVRDARRALERGDHESLALHLTAWALGGRDLVTSQGVTLSTPEEIVVKLRDRQLDQEAVATLARDGALSRWLRLMGRPGPAAAAELLAQGSPSGMRRLGWSLGQPFWIRERSFADPSALAREAVGSLDLRGSLAESFKSGDLLAWMESLPPALRPETWITVFRTAAERAAEDQLPLWSWAYRVAQQRSLTLQSGRGRLVTLTSLDQLRVTQQVADVWDGLKVALRTGELQGWLAVHGFETTLDLPRPPADEDVELNALLWDLGHSGLVLEWGQRDFAVTTPTDLVRAYQTDWEQFESQVRRGYVLAWLDRFHGETALAGKLRLCDVTGPFRAEIPRLPSGFVGLKIALLCGLRYLPLDPTRPGDAATFRGFSTLSDTPGAASAWEPLRDHFAQGSAQLWLSRLPDVGPRRGPALAQGAFLDVPLDAMDGSATASLPPAPPSKGRGRKRAPKQPPRAVDALIGRLAKTLGAPQPSPALLAETPSRVSSPPIPPILGFSTASKPPAPPAPSSARSSTPPSPPSALSSAPPAPSSVRTSVPPASPVSAFPALPPPRASIPAGVVSPPAPTVLVWAATQVPMALPGVAHLPPPEFLSIAWITGETTPGGSPWRAVALVLAILALGACCCSIGMSNG